MERLFYIEAAVTEVWIQVYTASNCTSTRTVFMAILVVQSVSNPGHHVYAGSNMVS